MKFSDLPDELPIFPLSEVLLLPKGKLPLNIFEQRYIDMVNDALATDHRMIGIVQPIQNDDAAPNAVYQIGGAGRITTFEEESDGRYVITLTGISRFQIVKEISTSAAYRQVTPDWVAFECDIEGCDDCGLDVDSFVNTLEAYLTKKGMICDKWEEIKDIDQDQLVDMISMVCPFSSEEKQALLEAENVVERAEILITLMDMALRENVEQSMTH